MTNFISIILQFAEYNLNRIQNVQCFVTNYILTWTILLAQSQLWQLICNYVACVGQDKPTLLY